MTSRVLCGGEGKAPFPYFGGKSRCATEVWQRFGNPPNYVEPFAGSLAVLLQRPDEPGIETVNDLDGFVANAWRAIASDPDEVAYFADWPVSEADLTARHAYLVERRPWLTERLIGDPSFCDPKLAGWWIWGTCAWIGTGWCSGRGPWVSRDGMLVLREESEKLPHLGDPGRGINRQLPHLGDPGRGINRKLPHLGTPGAGVNRKLPHLGTPGAGVNRKLPHLGDPEEVGWTAQGLAVRAWMRNLQERIRRVRIVCGDWTRVVTPAVTVRHGLTAVLLDPPYAAGEMEYSSGSAEGLAVAVREWCLENGSDPRLRIALCGHEGEHDLPGWSVYRWKNRGGYGNQGGDDAEDLRHRETIWFSPHCLNSSRLPLFDPAPLSQEVEG